MTASSTDARDRLRLPLAAVLLASPLLVIAVLCTDAHLRRQRSAAQDEAVRVLARRLPSSDLALSGGARWLRAVSLEEPGAAFADGPALPDPDPAGAAVAPPLDVWTASAPRELVVKRSGQP